MTRNQRRWLVAGALGLLLLLAPERLQAHAGHAHVTTLADSLEADGRCSLREALVNTNQNAAVHRDCPPGGAGDLILFDVSGVIALTSDLPAMSDPTGLVIDGSGRTVVLDGRGSARPLTIEAGVNVEVRGLGITGGRAEQGGGIYNAGTLKLTDVSVAGSRAGALGGGGIANTGQLTVANVTLEGNTAAGPGGGLLNTGTATLGNLTVSGNTSEAAGGGLANTGALTLAHATVVQNRAGAGGGLWSGGGSLSLANSLVAENEAPNGSQCAGMVTAGSRPNLVPATDGCIVAAMDDVAVLGVFGFLLVLFTVVGLYAVAAPRSATLRTFAVVAVVYALACGANAGFRVLTGLPLAGFAMGFGATTIAGPAGIQSLGDNGGHTRTHALVKGSGAIDKADTAVCVAAPVGSLDQRGLIRPEGPGCDLGAVEAIPLGGRDAELAVRDGAFHLTWKAGMEQDAYVVHRWDVDADQHTTAPISATAAAAQQPAGAAGRLTCLGVAPTGGNRSLGLSDVLCGMPGTGGGSLGVPQINLRLRGAPVAALSWQPVANAQRYMLASIAMRGGALTINNMAAGPVSNAAHHTQGGATCYTLVALNETAFGMSDVLCAVPGMATVYGRPSAGATTVENLTTTLRPGLQSVREQMAGLQARLETGLPLQ